MADRPQGRQKNYGGQGKTTGRRGEGLNTGPVGRTEGYQNRPGTTSGAGQQSGGQHTVRNRALGGGGLLVVLALVALLGFGGGGGGLLSGLLGGGSTNTGSQSGYSQSQSGQSGYSQSNSSQASNSSNSSHSSNSGSSAGSATSYSGFDLSSLLGGTYQESTVSTGWTRTANTGKLDTTVAPGIRDRYTTILGNNQDVITIMVYLCGTDLESKSGMASSDLQEMTKATLSDNVNVIVYSGGCKAWKNSIISNSVNQIYKVENGGVRRLVSDDGNKAMTKPDTLSGFIKYCTKNFPANRNVLILWDHGGGSLSGYGYDEKYASAGSMTLSGINTALKNANTKFDFIGFDTCLMATLENALMLNSYADYLVASEETEPGVGWYYTDWLTKLSQNTSMPTIEIGKNIIDDFVRVCNSKCPGQKTTLSLIDLAELSATVPDKLSAFAVNTSSLIESGNYQTVSDARSGAREYATSSKIDQIDLAAFAYRLGTPESEALAKALLGAVKYNKTSKEMTDSYGLSIYFPYRRASKVSSAVSTYNAIGMDSDYSRCIQAFAGLEQTGQGASNASGSPLQSLMGDGSDFGSLGSFGDIGSLLGMFLGGDRAIDTDALARSIEENRLDAAAIQWVDNGGERVLNLSDEDWKLVNSLVLNVFLDDGEGFIDLGTDNVYDFNDAGQLVGSYDGTWLAIDGQPIAYYYESALYEGDDFVITGRVPVLRNGAREELLIVFDNEHPTGYIAGTRNVYVDGETETVAKAVEALEPGDVIDFLCDYYRYDGSYENTYMLGEQWTYTGEYEISNVTVDGQTSATYLITDLYGNEYWTPEIY